MNGSKRISEEDMDKISRALGKNIDFFLSDQFETPKAEFNSLQQSIVHTQKLTKNQEDFAAKLVNLIETADEILTVRNRFNSSIIEN